MKKIVLIGKRMNGKPWQCWKRDAVS